MDENPQSPSPNNGSNAVGKKVIQPSETSIAEIKAAQQDSAQAQPKPLPLSQPTNSIPSGIQPEPGALTQQQQDVAPSQTYPVANRGIGAEPETAAVAIATSPATDASDTLFSRVSGLKTLVLLGVGLSTLELLLLIGFRKIIFGSIALFHLADKGALGDVFVVMAYAIQVSVIVNLLIFLLLTLSKSIGRVNKLLSVLIVLNILYGVENLLSVNIIGIVIVIIIIVYIKGVISEVEAESVKIAT